MINTESHQFSFRGVHEKSNQFSCNKIIPISRTWRTEDPKGVPNLQVVTRRSPNVKDAVFRRKRLALGPEFSSTNSCAKPGEKKRGRLIL